MPQIDSIRLACSLVSPLAHRARSAHSATHPLTVTAYITHRRRRLPFHGTAEREEEKEKGLSNLDTYVGYFANSMSNRSCHRIGLRPLSLWNCRARGGRATPVGRVACANDEFHSSFLRAICGMPTTRRGTSCAPRRVSLLSFETQQRNVSSSVCLALGKSP